MTLREAVAVQRDCNICLHFGYCMFSLNRFITACRPALAYLLVIMCNESYNLLCFPTDKRNRG